MISIYTDGSFRASENKGGYGVIAFNENNEIIYAFQKQENYVTNNQMELKAIIHAVEVAEANFSTEKVIIYSDSAYCVNSINIWSHTWAANGWINSKKETVKNLDLMKILYEYFTKKNKNFQINKTSGHANIIGNELADALATANKAKILKIIKENSITIKKFDF